MDFGTIFFLFMLWLFYYTYTKVEGPLNTWLEKRQEKSREKKREEEFGNWLRETEPLYRNLHRYPEDWGMRRNYIADRENYTCQICGKRGWLGFHVHHIKPLSKGGINSLDNLSYLCERCHENQHEHMLSKRLEKEEMQRRINEKMKWKRYWERKKSRRTSVY